MTCPHDHESYRPRIVSGRITARPSPRGWGRFSFSRIAPLRNGSTLRHIGENDIELPILCSEHLTGDGQEMFERAAKLNWEDISKNADAPYCCDRNEAWLKFKCVQKGKFQVIGFVKNPTGVAAFYLRRFRGSGTAPARATPLTRHA